jgi:biopolymer transport protein ExbD
VVMVASEMAAALIATAAGLLVAIPAAVSYNILRTRVEMFESDPSNMPLAAIGHSSQFAQKLSLKKRFSGLPPFALLAAPAPASLVAIFTFFQPHDVPAGLSVRLLQIGSLDNRHHEAKPVLISVVIGSPNGSVVIRVNSKETPLDQLDQAVRKLKVPPQWTAYVEVEDTLAWDDVVKVIDVLKRLDTNVVLLTTKPNINVSGS